MKAKKPNLHPGKLSRWKSQLNAKLQYFIHHQYRHFLTKCINKRYNTIAVFVGVLILSVALVTSGKVRWVFFPDLPSDFIQVNLEMDSGSSEENTLDAVQALENSLYAINHEFDTELGSPVVKHSFISLNSRTSAFIFAELTKAEDRSISGNDIAARWREALPELVGIKKLNINSTTNGGNGDISFRLISSNLEELANAADELKVKLASFKGVYGITDNFSSGSQEIRLKIRPEAEALGLTLADLARQVRYGFYGYEAQRILRNKEEIKVMVRYPLEQRRTIGHLENMLIRTASGESIPFATAANIELGDSYSSITRVDGRRAITITANADKNKVEPSKIVSQIKQDFFPHLINRYPHITTSLDGGSADEEDALISLVQGFFFALFTIYALMAIPLKSYSHPLIVMSVIPFGIIGALFGHFLMGINLSILSLCGIVALTGVVVNDSLILVDFVNRARKEGETILTAAINASCHRFRAILLTSLTTFCRARSHFIREKFTS